MPELTNRRTVPRIGRAPEWVARPAFSLIEMVVVVSVLAILTAMAAPRFDFAGYKMDAAARLTRSTLQKAERIAVTRQFDVIVSFDAGRNAMRVLEDANNSGSADAGEVTRWYPLEEGARFAAPPQGVNGPVSTSIVGVNVQGRDGMPSITYRRDGSASTDLEVYMTSAVNSDAHWRGVTVVESTGRAGWFKLAGTAWKEGGL